MTAWEDVPVTLAQIEHYAYCPRQWAIITMEQTFTDNADTTAGHIVHETVDKGESSTRNGLRVERSLPVWSDKHCLYGIADTVEFREGQSPLPVEYKSSRLRMRPAELQLVGQAVCLEEMFSATVSFGFLYMAKTRQRLQVDFTAELRSELLSTAEQIRAERYRITNNGAMPKPVDDKRCDRCSLAGNCLPKLSQNRQRIGGIASAIWAPS